MSEAAEKADYLVISRGAWKEDASRDEIEQAILSFYRWYNGLIEEGKIHPGRRLSHQGKTVHAGAIMDGPFGETKEVIGGYWLIHAGSLDEAARIAQSNPCLELGLFLEVRPINIEPATPENTLPR
jgi:hypothetical protein